MSLNIVPIPKEMKFGEDMLALSASISSDVQNWQEHLNVFCSYYKKLFNIDMSVSHSEGIRVIYCDDLEDSAYRIVAGEKVKVYAHSGSGVHNALATLLQLADKHNGVMEIPVCEIYDYPDKDYRGLMVDVARKWHPFETLLRYVDLCYFYKINYLQIHFNDNENYTLPSEVLPRLEEGYSYSFEEIKTLVGYAKERSVTIVPELDSPGHMKSIIKIYPEYFGHKKEFSCGKITVDEYGRVLSSADNILCIGNERSLQYIKLLIDEICEMFPYSPIIHLGGDEASVSVWESCPDCVEYMQKNGIAGKKAMYTQYIIEITDYLLKKGKIPIVWEGFPRENIEKLSRDVIVISWENYYHSTIDLLKEGFKIINCSWQPLYIVPNYAHRWNAEDVYNWSVYNWQHWWEKSEATLNPVNISETDSVMGAQLCSWECSFEQEFTRVAENICALSERVWNVKKQCSFKDFIENINCSTEKFFKL